MQSRTLTLSWLRLVLVAVFGVALLPATVAAQFATPIAMEARSEVEVACDEGESLADAIDQHGGDTRYEVSGTCDESVTVSKDNITIDGAGSGVIDAGDADGPAIHVESARHLTVRGLTVQHGQHGMLIENLSTVTLDDVEATGNESHGIEIIQSHADITNLHSHGNGRVGLIVNRNSEIRVTDSTLDSNGISGLVIFSSAIVRFEGATSISDNAAQGLTVGLGGMIFAIGSNLAIESNGAQGFSLLQNGSAQFLGGTLNVQDNAGDGLSLDLASTLALGMGDFEVPGEVRVEGNDGNGISVLNGSNLVIDPIMPATIQSNSGDGIYIDASAASVSGSTIEANGSAGLALDFGATATIEDMAVEDVTCGDGVMLRGSVSCP